MREEQRRNQGAVPVTVYWAALALLAVGVTTWVPKMAAETWSELTRRQRQARLPRWRLVAGRAWIVAQAALTITACLSYAYLVAVERIMPRLPSRPAQAVERQETYLTRSP